MYQSLAARIEGKPEERILGYLALRSLASTLLRGQRGATSPSPRPYTVTFSPRRFAATQTSSCIASPKTLLRAGSRAIAPSTLPASARPGRIQMRVDRHSGCPILQTGSPRPSSPQRGTRERKPPLPETKTGINQLRPALNSASTRCALPELAKVSLKKPATPTPCRRGRAGTGRMRKKYVHAGSCRRRFAASILNPANSACSSGSPISALRRGLVPIDTLRRPLHLARKYTHEIIGERTGRRFPRRENADRQGHPRPHSCAGTNCNFAW